MIRGSPSLAEVKYIGDVHYSKGTFVGVIMKDRSKGKNDGSVRGQRYFTCPKGAGLMVSIKEVVKA